MQNKTEIIAFINAVLVNRDDYDVSIYKSSKFARDLRLVSIDGILHILLHIRGLLVRNKVGQKPLYLSDLVNITHPQTKLSILDYCLVAGLDKVALELKRHGARCTKEEIFKQKILNYYKDCKSPPYIVQDIQDTIAVITDKSQSSRSLQDEPDNWAKLKYPAVFLAIGAAGVTGGVLAYPLFHGAASVLLFTIGVPSLFSSVHALQSSNNTIDRETQEEARERIAYEAEELQFLINMLINMEIELKKPERMQLLEKSIIAECYAEKNRLLVHFNRSTSEPTELKGEITAPQMRGR